MTREGDVRRDDNFVVRTRELWAAQGYAVLIPDTIDRDNLRGVRSSSQYARVVESLIGFARDQVGVPAFLLGTSQGSIAAMNGAAHADAGSLAGVVCWYSIIDTEWPARKVAFERWLAPENFDSNGGQKTKLGAS